MSFHPQQKLPYLHLDRDWGLPSGQVHKLAITSDNDVWMATPAGLSHYDGIRIQTYTQKDGLSTHGLRTVYSLDNDQLLVGTDVNLDQRVRNTGQDGTQFNALIKAEDWKHGFIECLLKNADGTFWLGTPTGLFHFTPATRAAPATAYLCLKGFIQELGRNKSGRIWVLGKPFGLSELDPGSENSETLSSQFPYALEGIETICVNPADPEELFVGGRFGVKIINPAENAAYELIPPIADNVVSCLCCHDNDLWVGTNQGLYVTQLPNAPGADQPLELKPVLSNHQISDIKADSVGNIWVASNKNGVFKYSFMHSFCIEYEHPELESVFSVRAAAENNIAAYDYLLASKSGVFSFSRVEGLKRLTALQAFKEHVWDVHAGFDGRIWVAAESGFYLYDKLQRLRKLGDDHPVCRSPNRCLLDAGDGRVYLGTQSGLALIGADEQISEVKDSSANSLGYVYALEAASNSHLYVGTIGNGAWYGSVLGMQRLKSEYIDDLDSVYSICRHGNGSVIFICNNKVILKYKSGDERLLLQTGHPIAGWSVKWETDEIIWIGSSNGLYEIDTGTGEILRNFKSLPGASLWEFNFSESLFISKRGDLLCGLRGNFALVDTKGLRSIRQKPELTLKSHTWINAANHLLSEYHIKEGKWSLQLHLGCSWSLDEENLNFRYRLLGFDEEWSELQKPGDIHYNSLPNGKYVLKAQACSPLFGWGNVSDLFSFEVSINSRFGKLLTRVLKPLFLFTRNVKATWRNLRLHEEEKKAGELLRSRLRVFEQDKQQLIRENLELEKHSNIDSLTNIANRRAFDRFLQTAIEQAARQKTKMAMILLDIDNFKSYNHTYGHVAGDDVLKQVAAIITDVMRSGGDFLARYGGEEFAIILPHANRQSANALAKRIREAVWEAGIEHLGQVVQRRLSCSLGVVNVDFAKDPGLGARDIVHQADKNLYRAKQGGKNMFITTEFHISEVSG